MPWRSRLQFLFNLAERTFGSDRSPTPQQLEAIKLVLGQVPLEELGMGELDGSSASSCDGSPPSGSGLVVGEPLLLPRQQPPSGMDDEESEEGSGEEEMPTCSSNDQGEGDGAGPRPPITYLHIYEDQRLSLGIFRLPARAQIPLHNHPGMTVMSRVLYGSLAVKSYDWFDAEAEGRLPREGRCVVDRTYCGGDEPVVLFPSAGGNIHQFTATTDCAVLDLMSPPYSTDEGRDCTYFSVAPQRHGSGDVVLLDEAELPSDYTIKSGEYVGLRPRLAMMTAPTPIYKGDCGGPGHSGHSTPRSTSGRSSPTFNAALPGLAVAMDTSSGGGAALHSGSGALRAGVHSAAPGGSPPSQAVRL